MEMATPIKKHMEFICMYQEQMRGTDDLGQKLLFVGGGLLNEEQNIINKYPEEEPNIIKRLNEYYNDLVHDSQFENVFKFIKKQAKSEDTSGDCLFVIHYLSNFIMDLASIYLKLGHFNESKNYFMKILEFCWLAHSKHKLVKYKILRLTCQNIRVFMIHLEELDIVDKVFEYLAKITKLCEQKKPIDFGYLRLARAFVLKQIGKPDEALKDFIKALDHFRRLVFECIDMKRTKHKDYTDELEEDAANAYREAVNTIYDIFIERGDIKRAIDTYERYLKRLDLLVAKSGLTKNYVRLETPGKKERLILGRLLFNMGQTKKALALFRRIIDEDAEEIERQINWLNSPNHDGTFWLASTTHLEDCDTFDLLNMIFQCRDEWQPSNGSQKRDVYLTNSMEFIVKNEDRLKDDWQNALNALLTLCIKTYWDNIEDLKFNEVYFKKLNILKRGSYKQSMDKH